MGKQTHLTLFEAVYPGLVAGFGALAGSELAPSLKEYPNFKFASDDRTLMVAEMAMRRLTKTKDGRDAVVQIAVRVKRENGVWVNKYASFHCGPDPGDMTLVFFRIDNEVVGAKHCHVNGYGDKPAKGSRHIQFEDISPPPTLDPNDFLSLVEQFIATGEIPLKVRK